MATTRTIITISEKEKHRLKAFSKSHGISMSAAIRQGITRLITADEKNSYQQIIRDSRGIWKKGDGLNYQKKIRAEWDTR
jgi:hypothetical protein